MRGFKSDEISYPSRGFFLERSPEDNVELPEAPSFPLEESCRGCAEECELSGALGEGKREEADATAPPRAGAPRRTELAAALARLRCSSSFVLAAARLTASRLRCAAAERVVDPAPCWRFRIPHGLHNVCPSEPVRHCVVEGVLQEEQTFPCGDARDSNRPPDPRVRVVTAGGEGGERRETGLVDCEGRCDVVAALALAPELPAAAP